uniref:Uncharacterized protein n=1 Tax=Panagrolaimus davidi TaxID=227884 RepID=A0A914PGK2_9BILA
MAATALNFDLLHKFLTADSEAFKRLSEEDFTVKWMVPFQIIRSFIRAIIRFVEVLDPEVFYVDNDFFDEWFALIESTYPISIIINVTSGLCWAHVLEKVFEVTNSDESAAIENW